jgi:hypothetical protein
MLGNDYFAGRSGNGNKYFNGRRHGQNENNSSITMVPDLTHFISRYQLPSRGGFLLETQLEYGLHPCT